MIETAAQSLLDATREILPLVRAGGDVGERERRLPRHVADAMAEIGICRMLAPRAAGGLEVDPMTYLNVIEALSRFYDLTDCHGIALVARGEQRTRQQEAA